MAIAVDDGDGREVCAVIRTIGIDGKRIAMALLLDLGKLADHIGQRVVATLEHIGYIDLVAFAGIEVRDWSTPILESRI